MPHIKHLYHLAYRFTNNQADAEDLVQDLLLHLYPRRAELDKIENLRPWLAKVLYNRFIDGLRLSQRNPLQQAEEFDEQYQNISVCEHSLSSPEAVTERHLESKRLTYALTALNPDQRVLVSLYYMEGYNLLEVAKVTGTPVGTLKSRLHRAREKLVNVFSMEPKMQNHRVKERAKKVNIT